MTNQAIVMESSFQISWLVIFLVPVPFPQGIPVTNQVLVVCCTSSAFLSPGQSMREARAECCSWGMKIGETAQKIRESQVFKQQKIGVFKDFLSDE